MRPPSLTLARIPVGRHTVVGSDMVPVLARDKMTWKEREGRRRGGDATWPVLPLTTALHLKPPPIWGKRQGVIVCDFFFSVCSLGFGVAPPCLWAGFYVNLSASVQQRHGPLNQTSMPFPCNNPPTPTSLHPTT